MAFGAIKLPFADHVHRLNACDKHASAAKCLESQHGSHDALDGPVVLLDDVVEVLDLTHLDVRAGIGLNALDGRRVGAALVDGDFPGHAVQTDGALQKAPRRSTVSRGTEQKVDRVAVSVDGPVQVLPLAGDLDVSLVQGLAYGVALG